LSLKKISLSIRGAELIEDLRQKQINEQMERESQILEKIKFKMERIKASQKRVQGPAYREPDSHSRGNFRAQLCACFKVARFANVPNLIAVNSETD